MRRHRIKTLPPQFERVQIGQKTFEARLNDRDYQVGDIVDLEYFDPQPRPQEVRCGLNIITKRISYVLHGGQFGIEPGYCVFAMEDPTPELLAQIGLP